MVAMRAVENRAAPTDNVAEATAAIEELRAAFGIQVLITALIQSGVTETFESNPDTTRRVIQFVLREIVFSKDPQLEAEIMAIGAGVLDDRGIETRIADKHRVSRAAISKRVVAFCDEWKLPPSAAMKSSIARKTYSERNQPRL